MDWIDIITMHWQEDVADGSTDLTLEEYIAQINER